MAECKRVVSDIELLKTQIEPSSIQPLNSFCEIPLVPNISLSAHTLWRSFYFDHHYIIAPPYLVIR